MRQRTWNRLFRANQMQITWWRHQMEHFSLYCPFVRGIHRSPVNSPHKGPVTQSFDVFFAWCFSLRLTKPLSKQSWGWWFETPSRSLWRHCNEIPCIFRGLVLRPNRTTSNGSWCKGIRGRMFCAIYFTLLWKGTSRICNEVTLFASLLLTTAHYIKEWKLKKNMFLNSNI